MPNEDRDIILSIYDAAADPSLWSAALDRVAESVGARGCLIFEIEDQTLAATQISSYYDPKVVDGYLERHREEELADHAMFLARSRAEDGVDIISDSILYHDIEAFRARPNVRATLMFGLFHRAACLLNKDNANLARFSIQFGADRGPITDAEQARLNLFLPHVAKALDLGRPARRLAAERVGLLAAIDRLGIGVCVLDRNGGVVAANEEFRRQEDAHRVFRADASGRLAFARPEDHGRFEALRAAAENHGHFGARPRKEAIETEAGSHLCIEVAPLERSEEIGAAPLGGVIVYSADASRPIRCDTGTIRQAFGLTAAEHSIVEAVSEGLTNAQIAERRDRSVATVNAQVKAVLSKTGCSTRTQLARMMLSFGASYLAENG